MSQLSRAIGLIPDGDYGEKTASLVAMLQYSGFQSNNLADADVDGHCGPTTREEMNRAWELDLNAIPMQEGGACLYVSPDHPKPQLWDGKVRAAQESGKPNEPETEEAATDFYEILATAAQARTAEEQ